MAAEVEQTLPVDSLSHFKRNTADVLRQMRDTGQPLLLTVHGKVEVVIQDPISYQKMHARLAELETLEALRQGLEETRAGKGRPAEEVLAEIRKEFAVPESA